MFVWRCGTGGLAWGKLQGWVEGLGGAVKLLMVAEGFCVTLLEVHGIKVVCG